MSWNVCKMPECESYTARPDGDYCESCRRANAKEQFLQTQATEKRKKQIEKAKSKNQQKRKPINKVSAKREELNKKYFKLVEQFKKDNPECKAKVNVFCTRYTDHPHHKKGRTGDNLMDVSTWLPVCASCHSFIEAHPKEAKEKGWSLSRLQTTEPHKI